MKKWISFISVLVLIAMLSACGKPASNQNNAAQNGAAQNNAAGSGSNQAPSANSNDSGTIELSYAFFAPSNTFPAVQMKKWAEELEKRTNGKVKVKLFPGGTLLTANNMFDGVAKKVADIGLTATSYEPGRFPLFTISDMPNGYPNARVASLVVYDQQYYGS